MEYDASTYPSRSFIRFTARNQLMADLTGRPIPTFVQRLGGETYIQQVTPSDQPDAEPSSLDALSINLDWGSSLNTVSSEDTPDGQIKGQHEEQAVEEISLEQVCHASQNAHILDETLLEEIVKTIFNLNRYPELYQPCGTKRAAAEVENRVAEEIVATYKEIKLKQQCPLVQRLNTLL
jgi:hypothetical protein